MVKIDYQKLAEINRRQREALMRSRELLLKKIEKHSYKVGNERLGFAVIPSGNGGMEYGLYGELPKERCVFDNERLKRASSIVMGGSDMADRSYFQCSKCRVLYDLPLGEKERKEHRERQSKIVFG